MESKSRSKPINHNSKPIRVFEEENRFLIQKENVDEIYEIQKTKNINIINKINFSHSKSENKHQSRTYECYGILGLFNAEHTDYLILISDAIFVGEILKSKFYKISKVKLIKIILDIYDYYYNIKKFFF